MWDNPRRLNLVAGILVGLALLVFALAGAQAISRAQLFPLRHLEVTTPLKQTTRADLEAALAGRSAGDFFAADLREVRAALESLPWVRRVSVRRVWPDRVEAAIEEHVPFARWGDDALINTYGERFSAHTDAPLPLFVGPAGSEREIALRYARFAEVLAPLGSVPERVVLTARYAWQVRLASGLNIQLGRDADAAEARLRRFVEAYGATLKGIARNHEYVDLRYPNGFALRIPEWKG